MRSAPVGIVRQKGDVHNRADFWGPRCRRDYAESPAPAECPILNESHGGLAQETVKILIFPAPRSVVAVKFTFPAIELAGVYSSSPVLIDLFRYHGVEHFVVNDVFKEPGWNERRIQQR